MLALYLKFNYLLLPKSGHDWEFIIRIDGKNLKKVSDPEFQSYSKLISHITLQMPQIMNEINHDDDVFILKGARRNMKFQISEFKKECENSHPHPINFRNLSQDFSSNIFMRNQLYNPAFLFRFITATMLNEDSKDRKSIRVKSIAKQCFELPKRNIELRMENLSHLFGRVSRFNEFNLFGSSPITAHISKLTPQLSIRYEYPTCALFAPSVLGMVFLNMASILMVISLLYCNAKVFGFSYFYNTFSAMNQLANNRSPFGFLKFMIFWAYYFFAFCGSFYPFHILYLFLRKRKDIVLHLLLVAYCLFNVLLNYNNYSLNLDMDKKYYLSPIELTQNLSLLNLIVVFGYRPISLVKDWLTQLFQKVRTALRK